MSKCIIVIGDYELDIPLNYVILPSEDQAETLSIIATTLAKCILGEQDGIVLPIGFTLTYTGKGTSVV